MSDSQQNQTERNPTQQSTLNQLMSDRWQTKQLDLTNLTNLSENTEVPELTEVFEVNDVEKPPLQHTVDPDIIRSETDYDGSSGSKILPTDWSDFYGVSYELVPLRTRLNDPFAISLRIVETLSDLEEYQETFILSNQGLDGFDSELVQKLLRLHGVVEYADTDTRPLRFRNPNYNHYDTVLKPITNTKRRKRIYDKHTQWGTQSSDWFCDHFGLSETEFTDWAIANNRIPPEQAIKEAQQRLARSIYTTIQWSAWDIESLAVAVNQPPNVLQEWIVEGVCTTYPNSEPWKVPARPSTKSWFSGQESDEQFWNADSLRDRVCELTPRVLIEKDGCGNVRRKPTLRVGGSNWAFSRGW